MTEVSQQTPPVFVQASSETYTLFITKTQPHQLAAYQNEYGRQTIIADDFKLEGCNTLGYVVHRPFEEVTKNGDYKFYTMDAKSRNEINKTPTDSCRCLDFLKTNLQAQQGRNPLIICNNDKLVAIGKPATSKRASTVGPYPENTSYYAIQTPIQTFMDIISARLVEDPDPNSYEWIPVPNTDFEGCTEITTQNGGRRNGGGSLRRALPTTMHTMSALQRMKKDELIDRVLQLQRRHK